MEDYVLLIAMSLTLNAWDPAKEANDYMME